MVGKSNDDLNKRKDSVENFQKLNGSGRESIDWNSIRKQPVEEGNHTGNSSTGNQEIKKTQSFKSDILHENKHSLSNKDSTVTQLNQPVNDNRISINEPDSPGLKKNDVFGQIRTRKLMSWKTLSPALTVF